MTDNNTALNIEVIKRDGSVQPFDINKIKKAFVKVYKNGLNEAVPDGRLEKLESFIIKKFDKKKYHDTPVPIEDIQDALRDFLMTTDKNAAEAFVIYREKRTDFREQNSKLSKSIRQKLFAKDVANQNANMDEHSFSGRIGQAASEVCKDYALKNSMSKMARKNHEDNYIYQHDLDSFTVGMHNCLSAPIDDMLGNGITTKQTDIRPASSINTAMQLTAVNFQLQSLMQFGGVSATHIDWTMVPYFRISFFKHYINGLKYIEGWSDKKISKFCDELGVEYKLESENNLSDDTIWNKIKSLF